jgi:HEAT repeat protein
LFPPIYYRLFPQVFVYCFGYAFVCGIAFGVWRIRLKSLAPLALVHAIVCAALLLPHLSDEYVRASRAYPKCRQIDILAMEIPAKAIPSLIRLMADRDDLVSAHALETLEKRFRDRAEPFLGDALRSTDARVQERLLDAVAMLHYPSLAPQVRAAVQSSNDLGLRYRGLLTLFYLSDVDGLRDIARSAPDQRIRDSARRFLGMMEQGK